MHYEYTSPHEVKNQRALVKRTSTNGEDEIIQMRGGTRYSRKSNLILPHT